MKIAPKLIDAFLQAPHKEHRAVLFYGPDNGLVRERAGKAVNAVLGAAASDPFAKTELSEAEILADSAKLADELSAVSMMSPQRVILIRDAGDKLTKIIDSAKECFHKDVFLIVAGDELSSRSSLRAFFEKDAACAAVACYKDEMRDVQGVIRQAFDTAGIRAERDAVDYLASQLGNDRFVTRQELEKCIIYAGDSKTLSLADVQALVDYNRDTNMDDIVNAVADRNLANLEKTLTQLLREGNQPIMYLRALQRYFNKLYVIRAQVAQGQSVEQVIAGLRPPVFFRQQPIITRHANQWGEAAIVKALKLLVEAELACKTSDLPAIPASSRKLLQATQAR